jgi:hypothetical protein
MFDRIALEQDLTDCQGQVLGKRGFVVSPQSIDEAARRAEPLPRRPLEDSALRDDVSLPLRDPTYEHLFGAARVRDGVERALRAVELPEVLYEELLLLRKTAAHLYEHALATAAVVARMLIAAAGPARAIPDVAAAALLHDLGMRHLPKKLFKNRDRLSREETAQVAAHPLLGAYHLACLLGPHPAVQAAHTHHWRCGQGYPALAAPPPRSLEVIAVASSFVALTQARPFRSAPYSARGATDVLVAEAALGHADGVTVKLLVHALRGGAGEVHAIRFGHERPGHAPDVNRHSHVVAPERSQV